MIDSSTGPEARCVDYGQPTTGTFTALWAAYSTDSVFTRSALLGPGLHSLLTSDCAMCTVTRSSVQKNLLLSPVRHRKGNPPAERPAESILRMIPPVYRFSEAKLESSVQPPVGPTGAYPQLHV